jgi:hypothetical protein
MQNLNYFSLDLRKNLVHIEETNLPLFTFPEDAEEILIVFEVDEAEGKSIEPDLSKLLENPQKIGVIKKDESCSDQKPRHKAAGPVGSVKEIDLGANTFQNAAKQWGIRPSPMNKTIELPAGNYFFAQVREILDEKGSSELAAEVQKEALWERRKLGTKIYLRYLYEHGSPVTQIFREMLTE